MSRMLYSRLSLFTGMQLSSLPRQLLCESTLCRLPNKSLPVHCLQLREVKMHQSIRDCRHPSLDIAMDANPPSAAAILAHRTLPTDQGDACRRSATMKITRRLKKSPPPYAPSKSRHPCSASCMAREDQELGAAVFHSALHRHWAASRR